MNKKGSQFKPRHILLILGVICILMLILSSVSSTVNNVIRSAFNNVLSPMQSGLNKIGTAISDSVSETARLRDIEEDYKKLQAEIEILRAENTRFELQEKELDQYKELLNMKEQYVDYPTIGAHVIGENSTNWNQTFLIDRGYNDGIEVNMNVIAQGGLVGIVTSVTANSSTVRAIIDHDNQVAGMALLSTDTCIVKGDLQLYSEGKIILEKIDKNADIYDDYKIVTGNKSSVYLPGILIGYARDIQTDPNSLTKSGYLIPIVDFSRLDSVLVITQLKETWQD